MRSADMLACYVWFPAHRRLLEEEVQYGGGGHNEPGWYRVYGCRQELQRYNQKRTSVCGKLSRLLSHGPNSRWVNIYSHWALVIYSVYYLEWFDLMEKREDYKHWMIYHSYISCYWKLEHGDLSHVLLFLDIHLVQRPKSKKQWSSKQTHCIYRPLSTLSISLT